MVLLFSDGAAEANNASKLLELGANGNGITPPDTPKRSQSPRAHVWQKSNSRSSSPVAIPSKFGVVIYSVSHLTT